jgi:plasmid stabilization system protein ParE
MWSALLTHLPTLLGGVALGAAGMYYAEKYTDRRREKEAASATRKRFRDLAARMPRLMRDMRTDIMTEGFEFTRELVILPSHRVAYNSDERVFAYYTDEDPQPALKDQVAQGSRFRRRCNVNQCPEVPDD